MLFTKFMQKHEESNKFTQQTNWFRLKHFNVQLYRDIYISSHNKLRKEKPAQVRLKNTQNNKNTYTDACDITYKRYVYRMSMKPVVAPSLFNPVEKLQAKPQYSVYCYIRRFYLNYRRCSDITSGSNI